MAELVAKKNKQTKALKKAAKKDKTQNPTLFLFN